VADALAGTEGRSAVMAAARQSDLARSLHVLQGA
jgi:hypothetical protein